MAFVHLHTHSEFSLLDGANRIPDLVARVKALGMDSLAVTDHGNLFAARSFYDEAKAQKIRPILGFEAYVAFGPRQAREPDPAAPNGAIYSHLVLLAQNRDGYKNLVKLSSMGFLEGYYRRPRIDKELLERHGDGIICLAACLSGEVALWLRQQNLEHAREAARWFARVFKDRFYLEVQDHGIPDEKLVAQGALQLAGELGLPVVLTNDAHYLRKEDADAHDVLLAIGTGKDLNDPKRFRFFGRESYVKSEEEMRTLFPDRPDVIANTAAVADRCEFDFEKRYFLPQFPRPAEYATDQDLLVHLATDGAAKRYGSPLSDAVRQRLEYELGVIGSTGYAGYFLIVYDFIKAARDRGIPVGPGRGSAAGSLVAYALGITNVDPLRFDLLFERFLNPERISMPDIDVDFCFERRGEVIEYVRERYGRDSVGQIITFGTLKARAAIKDVARTVGLEPAEADAISKNIPSSPGFSLSLAQAVRRVPELRAMMDQDERVAKVIALATTIEGLSRHASVHAAGIVIAPGPLSDYVPVCTAPQAADAIVTQYDMGALERVGMLKMDFLGLKTLTVIHDATRAIKERRGVEVDMDQVELEDPEVYRMLRTGRTAGVFQFESSLATDMLRQMKCDRFDDLVATNALMRPGPLDTGMHLVFINRKLGREPIRYPHPALEEILAPTYGVITYQEQVMRIANVLAGYSLAEADVMRKAVGKKDQELLEDELRRFVQRALERNHDRRVIEEISAQIKTFGRYGFPKAHSVAYSLLSYQTAWLKAHYPAEFVAALLSSEIGNTDNVVKYIAEARELSLEILPPDVNESGFKFTVVADQRVRFGLGAIRNVGEGAIQSIIAGRQQGGRYTTLDDFVERIDLRLCNKRVLEALIASGACDSLGGGGHRAQLIAALDTVLAEAQLRQADRQSGQVVLFEVEGPADRRIGGSTIPLPDVPPWTEQERLVKEKEVLGFFISGHPLDKYRTEVELFGTRTTATLGEWTERQVSVVAVVTAVKRQISRKSGAEYARLTLEDFHGVAPALVFPDAWAKLNQVIREDGVLLLAGGYSARDRGEPQAPFIVEQARTVEDLRTSGAVAVALRWTEGLGPDPETARAVAALCAAHPGPAPVIMEWGGASEGGNGGEPTARFRSRRLKVDPGEELLVALRGLVGSDHVQLVKS